MSTLSLECWLLGLILMFVRIYALSWSNFSKELPFALTQQSIGINTNGTIYLFGGRDNGYKTKIYKWENPPYSEWIELSPVTTPTAAFGATAQESVSIDNLVYFIGIAYSNEYDGEMFIFDMNTEEWLDTNTNDTTMPTPSSGGCIATNNKYIYHIGGDPDGTRNDQIIQIFNLSSQKWTDDKIPIPRSVAYQSCALFNNVLYWFGGSSDGDDNYSNEIYKYNTTSNKMSNEPIARLTIPTSKSRAIIGPDESIYIIGGQSDYKATSMVNIFDPYTESIINSSNLLFSVYNPTVAIVNFSIMVMGGQHTSYLFSSLIQQSNQIAPTVSFSFINNSNHGIYGGSLLLFDVTFNKHPTFNTEKYKISLLSDELNIDNKIEVSINECIIIKKNNTNSSCSGGLIIPSSIKILTVTQNMYKMHVSYHYSTFNRETIMILDRKILNISIILTKEVIFGESIKVEYKINNNNNSLLLIQSQSFITITSPSLNLNGYIKINYINNKCLICDISGCYLCVNGIFVSMTSNSIDKQYQITLKSNDSYLTNYLSNLTVISCPIGYSNIGLKCIQCVYNYYNIKPGNNCSKCDDNDNGYSCLGGSNIRISYNHWINIKNYSYKNNEIFNAINKETTIVSSICPSNYCCTKQKNQCSYNDTNNLCAKNRDYNTILCASCNEGYSEVYGSNACKKCDNNLAFLFLPVVLAFVYSIILGYNNISKAECKSYCSQTNNGHNSSKFKILKIMLLRSMIYFFQSIYFICSQYGIEFYLMPILRIFMLEMVVSNNNNSDDNGICFKSNLNAIDKQLWFLFLPFMMFIWLFIFKLLGYINFNCLNNLMQCIKYDISTAFWNCILISIGTFSSRMFKLLSCKVVGSVTVHFYAGYLYCYQKWWIFALIGISLSIALWTVFFVILHKMNIDKRNNSKQFLYFIIKPYKSKQWYWEFVLLSRRIVISLGLTFAYISTSVINGIVVILLIFYWGIQIRMNPFLSSDANLFESVCICLSWIALLCVNFLSDKQYVEWLSGLLFSIILIPIFLYFYYVIKLILNLNKAKYRQSDDEELNQVLLTEINTN